MGIQLNSTYLTIPVSNLKRSAQWYGEHFGFKLITEDPNYLELISDSGIRILFQQNDHNLHSHFIYPGGAVQSSYGFLVSYAESAYNYLIGQGVKVGEFFDYQGKSFSVYDPDGNFIEIWSLANQS
ncbi:VOC family protein [Paenibacillus mendelii]|uniref:VOC family protein n=1 Tax=Paenibacillus mendelii TaxID=206163 RepID=A0ABV6JF40_9BACL|nr:VOC family protein [Paenibacillus mendelii]MCQ6557357.1 VOC family protein [Paenibacillus mendelii]